MDCDELQPTAANLLALYLKVESMRCLYCGYEIVWTEQEGWIRHHFGTKMWGTADCPSRLADPKLGHALAEEEKSNE